MSDLKRQPIHIDPELHRQFKIWCTIQGKSMKEATEQAIRGMMEGKPIRRAGIAQDEAKDDADV
jgi:hypothetical protein